MGNTQPVPEAFPLAAAPHHTVGSQKNLSQSISTSTVSPLPQHHCSGLHHVKYLSKVGDTGRAKKKMRGFYFIHLECPLCISHTGENPQPKDPEPRGGFCTHKETLEEEELFLGFAVPLFPLELPFL